jgi:hypothetical protein
MTNKAIATLVPTQSDAEIAADLKRRVIEAHEPVLALLDEAHAAGFEIICGCGLAPTGRHVITHLRIAKLY